MGDLQRLPGRCDGGRGGWCHGGGGGVQGGVVFVCVCGGGGVASVDSAPPSFAGTPPCILVITQLKGR